jgi:hypothetical protein
MKQREQRRRTAVDTPVDTPVNNHYKYITNHKRRRTSADIDRKKHRDKKETRNKFRSTKRNKGENRIQTARKTAHNTHKPQSHNKRNKKNGYYM